MKNIVIVGGGAAGFFTAINIAEKVSDCKITILEKSSRLLSKVRISGGGRCNVTNGRSLPGELVKCYPRGQKKLYKGLSEFGTAEMISWLKERGVNTKKENDLRVFPVTDSSDTIIDCFLTLCRKFNIKIVTSENVVSIERKQDKWSINEKYSADYVVWATGSAVSGWKTLKKLSLRTVAPVPSLFTFNIKDKRLQDLQGLSFPDVRIKIAGTKLEEQGPLLITHWGLSGPAVLKLSAWGARELEKLNYNFEIIINFFSGRPTEQFKAELKQIAADSPKKKIKNLRWDQVPNRYWDRLISLSQLEQVEMGNISKKASNILTEECIQARFKVDGKSTFKEEFVTCGGVELSEVDLSSMESKNLPNLYLAGEVLNIDGITGGFNFQACWTSGWLISNKIKDKIENDRA